MCVAYSEIFSGRGHQFLTYFKRSLFRQNYFEEILRAKMGLVGLGACYPRKFFENLHTVVAILVVFEQFLGKFCLTFCP